MRLARRWNLQFRGWVLSFYLSRPGGGLFGRPKTRESSGRFLFVGHFSRPSLSFLAFCFQILASICCPISKSASSAVQPLGTTWSGFPLPELELVWSSSLLPVSARGNARARTLYVYILSAFWINSGTLLFGDVGYDVRPQLAYDDEGGLVFICGAVIFCDACEFAWEKCMRPVRLHTSFLFCIAFFALFSLILSNRAFSQQKYIPQRVNEPVDDSRRVVLKGNVHPMARSQHDVGVAPSNLPMERMLLVLKRSPEQQAALSKLLDDQQDKSSPSYHKWMTPDQFGQQFGPADSDIQAVTSWLQLHGLQVSRVSKGRTMIEFSGTAAQVKEALHTSIRKYVVKGEAHLANANDPEIPAALAPVVAGVHSLHNFYLKPLSSFSGERFTITRREGLSPQLTGNGSHALVPGDYSVIYNINPVYQGGIDGTGTTVAVVGRSNFLVQDVIDFQQLFALPFNPPQVIFDGADPGNLGGGEEAEALLDATWSGAVARGAAVKFVLSAGTDTTDGVVLSELYIIDNNVGDVMTQSFGGCEAAFTSTEALGFSVLAEEAAAQGITYVVASGDTGAAGCDNLAESIAQGPVSVSLQASTPFTIAAGGTQFNENGHDSTYWNSTNDPFTFASAKSYIPENVWNETCTTQCATGAAPLASGGGGVSTFFSKPSWQAGVSGIPNDGHRDIPDISLSAASHDPYILCFEGSCQSGSALGISGTSASAPSFAGMIALVNQQTGSRQGQAD